MKVILAKTAGFCFGVERAVKIAKETAEKNSEKIYSYGPIIHNDFVVKNLEDEGVIPFDTDDDVEKLRDKTVVIRSHGVGKREYDQLKQVSGEVVDCTCPFVNRIHKIVSEHSEAGEQVVVIGRGDHPEVLGIVGWSKTPCIVIEDIEKAHQFSVPKDKKLCIVVQTTFNINKFQDIVEIIEEKGYDIKAYDTICNATEERQTEAADIARQSDVMLVIGGKNSSNSRKLYQLCRELCPRTFFLQSAEGLDLSTFQGKDCVGITAGASTPKYIIEEVFKKCQRK